MNIVSEKVDLGFLEQNLQALFSYVQRVREEIASLNHSGDGVCKFESMGAQLDGIIEATKDATDHIMGAVEGTGETVEKLMELVTDKDQTALLNKIADNNNTVFEACAFQDLTGQRVTKIIKSVTYIEDRVNALREIWGEHELDKLKLEVEEMSEEEKLLHGPQMKADAITQDEIDKLFD